MLIRCGMFPSDDTWLIYWWLLWKNHAVLDDDVMIIDDDYGVNIMWMIFCYFLEIWHMLSWFMDGYDKALYTKKTKQFDLDEIKRMSWYLYTTYLVISWWYLLCHIFKTDDGHIQVIGLYVADKWLWWRSYMVYDSC